MNQLLNSAARMLGGENAGIGPANWAALNVTATTTKTQAFAVTSLDIGPAIIRATNANLVLGALSHNAGAGLVFVTNGNSGNLPAGIVTAEGDIIFQRGSAAYTVANAIGGGGSITKRDTGVLTLSGGNTTFTGSVRVETGTLRMNNNAALGAADPSTTTILSGASLDVGGPSQGANALTMLETITVSGSGVAGLGAIINSTATAQQNALRLVTLADHTTFGGTGRWDNSRPGGDLEHRASRQRLQQSPRSGPIKSRWSV